MTAIGDYEQQEDKSLKNDNYQIGKEDDRTGAQRPPHVWRKSISKAVKKTMQQMKSMLPVLLGVILLMGLFQTFISEARISSVFTGELLPSAFAGAALGSVLAGNPVNSYVIGKGLLDVGAGLVVAAALILTWVTVGLVQLPAEMSALGIRFALTRAAIAFVLSIPIACLTSWLIGIIS